MEAREILKSLRYGRLSNTLRQKKSLTNFKVLKYVGR